MQEVDPSNNINAQFGFKVAVTEKMALINATNASNHKGEVYVYTFSKQGKLNFVHTLEKPRSTYHFGGHTVADGDWAATNNIWLYQLNGNRYDYRQEILLPEEQNGVQMRPRTTNTLAMNNDILVIGDTSASVDSVNAGAIAIYRRGSDDQWTLEQIIAAPTPLPAEAFGTAVAVSGNTIVVSSKETTSGGSQGQAHIYQKIGANWTLQKTLTAIGSDDVVNFSFAAKISLDGDTLAVQCRQCNDATGAPSNSNSVYIFQRHAGGSNQWGRTQELTGSQASFIDNYGNAIRIRGNRLLITEKNHNKVAYIYQRQSNGQFSETDVFSTTEGVGDTGYGFSGDFYGTRTLIGAFTYPNDSSETPKRYGAVYAYADPTLEACGVDSVGRVFCDSFESD